MIKAFALQMGEEKQTLDQSDHREVRNIQHFILMFAFFSLNSCCMSSSVYLVGIIIQIFIE